MPIVLSIFPLLLGIGLLLLGIGLQGTLLPLRAAQEGFSVAVTGVMMSAYFMGFILGTFLCPRLIRRVGHIRAFAAFTATTAAAAIAHGMLIEPVTWTLLRVVTGTGMVGLYMVVESWLNLLAPNATRGRYFAVYTTTTLCAMALGQFLLLLYPVDGYRLFSLTAILVALAAVPIVLTRISQPAMVEAPRVGLLKLVAVSPLGFAGALISGLNNGAFWGLGALFAQRIGLSEGGIALFMSLTILGGALLQWPIGQLSDHYDRRRVLIAVSLLTAAITGLAWHALGRLTPWHLLFGVGYGGFAFALYGLSVAHTNDHLAPNDLLEGARNLLLVYGAGAVIGPIVAGQVMAQLGPGSLLLFILSTLLLLALFGFYRMVARSPLPSAAQAEYVAVVRTSPVVLELDPRMEPSEHPEAVGPEAP